MRINHNIPALNTHRQMGVNTLQASKSMEKLSSGLRINRAADDAAGLSISEKMRGQIRGLNQGVRNAQDGVSFIQTAEGALNEVSDMLVRLKELHVQKASGTYSSADKDNIDLEVSELTTQIGNIFTNTKFNGTAVFTTATEIAMGEDGTDTLSIAVVTPTVVGADAGGIDTNIDEVNAMRATYGSQQNRLEHAVNNMSTTAENLQAAESRVRDVDMAKEMMEFTKNNILLQAAQAMLAQANSQPQGVLQLLR
jgi:flagellin